MNRRGVSDERQEHEKISTVVSDIETRGVILAGGDLSGGLDWPRLAHEAGLTTIATHVGPADVIPFLQSEKGRKFLEDCRKYNLQVEHELHAMDYLLPRGLFATKPALFRMNKEGVRTNDCNCCACSPEARRVIAGKAVEVARVCKPTTGRYFYWLSDGGDVCHCPLCREMNAADQALLIENDMLAALRAHVDPDATLAHLAYQKTYRPPEKIAPAEGIFLEFAPMDRDRTGTVRPENLSELRALLDVFPVNTAQVLEYWLDVSFFSGWKKPLVKIPWNAEIVRNDVAAYMQLGIRRFSTFAVWLGDEYLRMFGEAGCVKEYGDIFRR